MLSARRRSACPEGAAPPAAAPSQSSAAARSAIAISSSGSGRSAGSSPASGGVTTWPTPTTTGVRGSRAMDRAAYRLTPRWLPGAPVDSVSMRATVGWDREPVRPRPGGRDSMSSYETALAADPEVASLIGQELNRQQTTLQLIASENFTSPAVLAASGSVLTNKYSEGYPGRRYYGGNQIIDEVEELARSGPTALFGADHANVQPHAGANANLAAYQALLEPGATILAMRLDHGGHLTHGSPASIVSKFWRFVSYGVTPESQRRGEPRRGHRLRPGGAPGQDGEARADRGRVDGVRPHHRSPALPRDRRLGGGALHVRRRPSGRPHRRWRAPEPGRRGRRRHLHHAQDAARPARRGHPVRGRAGQEDRQRGVPRAAGRAARARHRGQGGGLRRGGAPGVRPVRRRRS